MAKNKENGNTPVKNGRGKSPPSPVGAAAEAGVDGRPFGRAVPLLSKRGGRG
jgi:hypothetical protein